MKYDSAAESNKVYAVLVEKHNVAVQRLDQLLDEQAKVDAEVEDHNRIVLALSRSIRALAPVAKQPAAEDVDVEKFQRLHDQAIQDAAE